MWLKTPRKILLSYRRADTGPTAGRLADRLKRRFGDRNVFIDVDNIPFGTDFRTHIQQTIESCDVVLVVIGQAWVGEKEGRRRLDEAEDHLRIEVEAALQAGAIVIPVLVDRAAIPQVKDLPQSIKALPFLNAAPLDTGRDFNVHAARIEEAIAKAVIRAAPQGNHGLLLKKNAKWAVRTFFYTSFSIICGCFASYIFTKARFSFTNDCGTYGLICFMYAVVVLLATCLTVDVASNFFIQRKNRLTFMQIVISIVASAASASLAYISLQTIGAVSSNTAIDLHFVVIIMFIKLIASLAPKLSDTIRNLTGSYMN